MEAPNKRQGPQHCLAETREEESVTVSVASLEVELKLQEKGGATSKKLGPKNDLASLVGCYFSFVCSERPIGRIDLARPFLLHCTCV